MSSSSSLASIASSFCVRLKNITLPRNHPFFPYRERPLLASSKPFSLKGISKGVQFSHLHTKAMASGGSKKDGGGEAGNTDAGFIPLGSPAQIMQALRSIVNDKPMEAWDTAWKEGITPWDMGIVTPFVKDLISSGALDSARVFVPGCGSGYDVLAMTSAAKAVVGLDISPKAIARAIELRDASEDPKAKSAEFLCTDFFGYSPPEPFDVIFDYTFFVAMDPAMRVGWAKKMSELLSPQGQLVTLMFPISDHEGGPPYGVSPKTYEAVLGPLNFEATLIKPNSNSFPRRQGQEMIGYWRRRSQPKSVM